MTKDHEFQKPFHLLKLLLFASNILKFSTKITLKHILINKSIVTFSGILQINETC